MFEAVRRRELVIDPTQHSGKALEHVFTVLGLVLPAEPLRIALHALQTDDLALRATALEYLESILPVDLRVQLWPLLESEGESAELAVDAAAPVRTKRTPDELLAALNLAYPAQRAGIVETRAASRDQS